MEYNLLILKNILVDLRDIIECSDDYYQEFEYDVISKYNEYGTTIYSCLTEMYPVIFMHIAFYEVYLNHCYGNNMILDFKSYFIQYQQYSIQKYSKMVIIFYNKIKNLNPMDDLATIIEGLHI
jgi:hypothetical protein